MRPHYGRECVTLHNTLGASGHSMDDIVRVCAGSGWGLRRPLG
jgi:hypothetical protein